MCMAELQVVASKIFIVHSNVHLYIFSTEIASIAARPFCVDSIYEYTILLTNFKLGYIDCIYMEFRNQAKYSLDRKALGRVTRVMIEIWIIRGV